MIPLTKPFFDSSEAQEIKKVLDSGWVAGQGPTGKAFEEAFKERFGFNNAVAVNNCTAALHLALLSLGIKRGDEVLVADYTYPATAHAVKYCGAKPVFVDVKEDTYNIDVAGAEEKISEATVAIMPVHTFGQAADMNAVNAFAKKHGLAVVEDAACAVGAKYRGGFVGGLGDVGCFSFHARKGITTGEGGMIAAKSVELADHARMLSCFGVQSAFKRHQDEFSVPVFTELGYNYKLSDILAAVGVAQLSKLDGIIAKKRALVEFYREEFEGLDLIQPPFEAEDCFHVYQSFVCLLSDGVDRDKLVTDLRKLGVGAQIGTYSCHMQPVYGCSQVCPVSRTVFDRAIALPLYAEMNKNDVSEVLKALRSCLK